MNSIDFIAFDLDGTLLDTAKDFFIAVNELRSNYQLEPCEFNEVRSRVSEGAISLARYALSLDSDDKDKIEVRRQELLKIYDSCCLNETTPFE